MIIDIILLIVLAFVLVFAAFGIAVFGYFLTYVFFKLFLDDR